MLTLEEKRIALSKDQYRIDLLPYTPAFPYPYCCICFEKLTEHNIHENENGLINVCLDCKDK